MKKQKKSVLFSPKYCSTLHHKTRLMVALVYCCRSFPIGFPNPAAFVSTPRFIYHARQEFNTVGKFEERSSAAKKPTETSTGQWSFTQPSSTIHFPSHLTRPPVVSNKSTSTRYKPKQPIQQKKQKYVSLLQDRRFIFCLLYTSPSPRD